MPATITPYNHARALVLSGQIDWSTLRVMLLDGHTQDPTDTDLSGIEGDEVHGNGWNEGGEAVGSPTVTIISTNGAKIDGSDVVVAATGGAIGPSDGAVLVADDFTDPTPVPRPLAYIDHDEELTALTGANFAVRWNAGGIVTLLPPA